MPKTTRTPGKKRPNPAQKGCKRPEPDVVSIAADGDAILVVKDEFGKQEVKLRVRALLLRAASTFFSALFGPCFAEGQSLDSQNPPEISLVDDPASIEIICKLLHSQHDHLPTSLPAAEVLKLAQTIDKYDLSAAMSSASILSLIPDPSSEDLILLLEAALLLRTAEALKGVSRALILQGATPFVDIRSCCLDAKLLSVLCMRTSSPIRRESRLADEMADILEQERTKIRTHVSGMIFRPASQDSCDCNCRWVEKYNSIVLELANDNELSPHKVNTTTIDETISRLSTTFDTIVSHKIDTTGCSYEFHPSANDLRDILQFQLKDLLQFKELELSLDALWEDLNH